MKACRLRFNGKRYMVNAQSVVAEIGENDDCNVLGFETIQFCDMETTEKVLAEVKRLRHNKARRERGQSMRDLDMVKVRGNLGGTYWE